VAFQLGELSADAGERHAEPPGGGCQAAGLGHRHEYRHCFQSIHDYSIIWKYKSELWVIIVLKGSL
jgi:hypothetical protein